MARMPAASAPFVNLTDFHLETGSPCVDVGAPAILDRDCSRSDIGGYGGPEAELPR